MTVRVPRAMLVALLVLVVGAACAAAGYYFGRESRSSTVSDLAAANRRADTA